MVFNVVYGNILKTFRRFNTRYLPGRISYNAGILVNLVGIKLHVCGKVSNIFLVGFSSDELIYEEHYSYIEIS